MEFERTYFDGKVAVVTGGASGIGLALCEELLESGASKVILADFNEANLAEHETRLNEQYPGKVKGILCNVTIESDVKDMLEKSCVFGDERLDLLINCAGAALVGKFIDNPNELEQNASFGKKTATNEDWKKAFALNFFGPLYGCRHALPIMLRQGSGQIVNIISGIAFSPMAYQSMYAATKSALNILTLSLRAEYAQYNIKFNSATPGTTATPIFNEQKILSKAQTPHQSAQRILNGTANNDRLILGDDADIGGAIHCFLPDGYSEKLDGIFLHLAHERKSGRITFEIKASETQPEDLKSLMALKNILELIERSDESAPMDVIEPKIQEYLAERATDKIPESYYNEKTAAVTGGASGVGLALCEELLRCGAKKVVLADYNQANLDIQTQRLSGLYPGKVKGILCNVAEEDDVKAMIASSTEFFAGDFDILINCAGIGQMGMFSDMPDSAETTAHSHMFVETPKRWEQLYDINFYGPLYGCRAVMPIMLKQKHGQIVNIISGTAFMGMPYQTIYASTKAALNALTLVLRYEYWDDGIKFNSATPGTTATAIFDKTSAPTNAQKPEQSARRILTGVAGNERLIFGDDDDVLSAMLWGNPKISYFWDKLLIDIASSRKSGNLSDFGNSTNIKQPQTTS